MIKNDTERSTLKDCFPRFYKGYDVDELVWKIIKGTLSEDERNIVSELYKKFDPQNYSEKPNDGVDPVELSKERLKRFREYSKKEMNLSDEEYHEQIEMFGYYTEEEAREYIEELMDGPEFIMSEDYDGTPSVIRREEIIQNVRQHIRP